VKRRLDTSRSPSLCRRREPTQVRVDVRGLCSSVMRRPSPERHCVPKVRENARGVCVARWYDPATGEFTSVDPDLAETDQAYAYAGDDPVNAGDPSGLLPCLLDAPGGGSYQWFPYAPFGSSPVVPTSSTTVDAREETAIGPQSLFNASNCPKGTQDYKGDLTPFNCVLGVADLSGHKVLIRQGTNNPDLYPHVGAFGLLHMDEKHGLDLYAAQYVIGHEVGGESDGRYYYKYAYGSGTGQIAIIVTIVESRSTTTPPDHQEVGLITGGCQDPKTPVNSIQVGDCPAYVNETLPPFI
jgi:hypothetical protein